MSHDRVSRRERIDGEQEGVVAPDETTPSTTTFTSTETIPTVDSGGAVPGPTASELAYGQEPGPGVTALQALCAKGVPKPEDVVEVIDAHRGETTAIYAYLETTHGAAYVQQVRDAMGLRASLERREIVSGDPTDPDGAYFFGSAEEQGARWRTGDGKFTGTAGKTGLESTYDLDDNDSIRADVDKKGNGTLGWDHDGERMGELYRSSGGGQDELGLRRRWDLDDKGDLTTGLRHRTRSGASFDELFATHDTEDRRTTTTGALGLHDGKPSGLLGVTHKPNDKDTYAGELSHDAGGTTLTASGTHGLDGGKRISGTTTVHHGSDGTTGSIGGSYEDPHRRIAGSVTRGGDQTAFHLGGHEKLTPELTLTGSLDHVDRDHGEDQTTLRIGERYRSGKLVHGLDLEAGHGERDYLMSTSSVDAQLGDKLYGGAFGMFRTEQGQPVQSQLGASLTFTPNEKLALTLAGVLDQSGALETRLQLDVFKSKLRGVGDLADHKKDALLSVFVSYSPGGGHGQLDDRFGAPKLGTPAGEQVMAGIRIKF